jgi:KaiC/GvpD/RAD55 family RecA-like ATPase/DNA-binding response OmpR family regulator
MNGSTEVRPTSSSAATPAVTSARTDTPLPIIPAVPETAATATLPVGDRIISGIDLIDYGAGGLMPNHVYLVKGAGGLGKSLLGLQFLTRGLEHEEPGVLITDQKPEKVIAQAKAIGFGIDEAVKRNQLSILNPSSRYFDLVESPADVMAIVEELGDYVKRIGARRVVIDPIYTLINTQYSSHFAVTLTQSLFNALEDLPATVLLTAADEDDAERNPITRMLEQNAFGVLQLQQDPATGGRLMRITKLRYASNDDLSAHYRILNGRGLINYRGEGERVTDVTKAWDEPAQANRSVLLIGSQGDTIRKVKEALGDQYTVSAEADLKEGLRRVRSERPGLVLVTPQRSAGAISTILDLARNSDSSIAFLSPAANRQSDRVLYLRAGADDYFTEPFTPGELRARVDALIRRSGRRLTIRDSGVNALTTEDLASLGSHDDTSSQKRRSPVLNGDGKDIQFAPDFRDRLQRSIDTVSKLDTPFAVYWIKGDGKDSELNASLARLCRQEDILCHNRNGEFVAILTGTDANGVKGFETRLTEKLGDRFARTQRGHRLYGPGQTA